MEIQSMPFWRVVCALVCLAVVPAAAQNPAPAAQVHEIRLKPASVGEQAIGGFVLPPPASTDGFFVEVYDTSSGSAVFLDRKTIDRFERDGAFTVQLGAALRAQHRVDVNRTSGGVTPASLTATAPQPPKPPAILVRPFGIGDRGVSGVVVPAPASAAG